MPPSSTRPARSSPPVSRSRPSTFPGALRRLGYRETQSAPAAPGQFRRETALWEVHLRPRDDPAVDPSGPAGPAPGGRRPNSPADHGRGRAAGGDRARARDAHRPRRGRQPAPAPRRAHGRAEAPRPGRAGRRGSPLLRASRGGSPRRGPRRLGEPPPRRARPGREHAHPAARQEPRADAEADLGAEGARGGARPRARAALLQGRDPLGLPERHLPRPARRLRRVRRRRGVAQLLRQGRRAAHARRGRHARGDHPGPEHLLARPASRARARAAERGPPPDARPSDARRQAARPGEPGAPGRPARDRDQRPRAVLRGLGAGAGRAGPAGRRIVDGRPPDLHDAQSRPPARRRGGAGTGPRPPGGPVPRPPAERPGSAAPGSDRGARRPHRRDPRDGRGARLRAEPVQPRRAGAAAARLGLQAVRLPGGAGPGAARRAAQLHAGVTPRGPAAHHRHRPQRVDPAQLREPVRGHGHGAPGARAVAERRDGVDGRDRRLRRASSARRARPGSRARWSPCRPSSSGASR